MLDNDPLVKDEFVSIRVPKYIKELTKVTKVKDNISAADIYITAIEGIFDDEHNSFIQEIKELNAKNKTINEIIQKLEDLQEILNKEIISNKVRIEELERQRNRTPILYKDTEEKIKDIIRDCEARGYLTWDFYMKNMDTTLSLEKYVKSACDEKYVDFFLTWKIIDLIIHNEMSVETVLGNSFKDLGVLENSILKSLLTK